MQNVNSFQFRNSWISRFEHGPIFRDLRIELLPASSFQIFINCNTQTQKTSLHYNSRNFVPRFSESCLFHVEIQRSVNTSHLALGESCPFSRGFGSVFALLSACCIRIDCTETTRELLHILGGSQSIIPRWRQTWFSFGVFLRLTLGI